MSDEWMPPIGQTVYYQQKPVKVVKVQRDALGCDVLVSDGLQKFWISSSELRPHHA